MIAREITNRFRNSWTQTVDAAQFRMRLQAKEKLRKICVRDGQRLETQFHQFIASCDALNEFLSGISPGNSLVLNMEE